MALNKMVFDIDEMLDGFTRDGMKKFVKKLLAASEDEERDMLDRLDKRAASPEKESDDLADLKEEKSGKPSPIDMEAEPTRRKRDG
jgi:N-methylhydantoinase B/oxoprolinase/acetone carboxylase alpha subunit